MNNIKIFKTEVLPFYKSAVKLETYKLHKSIYIPDIKHKYKNTSWSGKGFLPLSDLKKFQIYNENIEDYFKKILYSYNIIKKEKN